ncbi:MAG: hypothetical protein ACK4S2_01815 [Gemmobacter sp.]|uniref:hypothetical protein n=1 Tax=Gemmobacter sp. TaxID=1898957 RepID=UPI00391A93C6
MSESGPSTIACQRRAPADAADIWADTWADTWADAPASAPRPARFRRPVIADDGSDVLVGAAGGSGGALLGFAGLANRLMAPLEWVDAFCAAQNHSAIYLRDPEMTLFQGGVPSLVPDLGGGLEALRDRSHRLETRRVICRCTSGGGFGAIRYGLGLGAAHVLCASPPTGLLAAERVGDPRAKLLVQRMEAQFGRDALDLAQDFGASAGATQRTIWFGADARENAAHARHVEGLPGVSLVPVPGYAGHMSFEKVLETGAFDAFVSGGWRAAAAGPPLRSP